MSDSTESQPALGFGEDSPASAWEREAAKRVLDELFTHARRYTSGKEYAGLLHFVAGFRFYSPFNAMLVHVQMTGATYVAPAHRWRRDYSRIVKPGARPLVILQPMGPVMFVFDVSEVEPEGDNAPPLPPEIERPFEVGGRGLHGEFRTTVENSQRDGVRVEERQDGSQSAGEIRSALSRGTLSFMVRGGEKPEYKSVPLRYDLILNSTHSPETKYATLVHELGHLYCGHLGTPNSLWWPDRRGLPKPIREFEAESVCFLVCHRLGIENPSAKYLGPILEGRPGDDPPAASSLSLEVIGEIHELGLYYVNAGAREFFEWSAEMIQELGPRVGPYLRAAWRTIKSENPDLAELMGDMGLNGEIPPISLNCVMKAAGLIEQMGRQRLSPRKEKNP